MQNNKIWDLCAPIYDRSMRGSAAAYENMCEKIRAAVRGMEVLEIACGTGLITRNIAEAAKHVTATDLSEKMLAQLQKEGLPENVTVQQENASALSFADDSFDAVIIANVLHLLTEPEKALAEAARVLKPGGLLIAPTFIHDTEIKSARAASKLLSAVGVSVKSKWDAAGYADFLAENGWEMIRSAILDATIPMMYTECVYQPEAEKRVYTQAPEKPDYKNWVPKGMVAGLSAGTAALAAGTAVSAVCGKDKRGSKALTGLLGAGTLVCGAAAAWSIFAHRRFSYDGPRKLSKEIVQGTAAYIRLPEGGVGLDVGCGSGALTIACAKRNPQAHMIGVDRWGKEYASFSQKLCEQNADAEGVCNVSFMQDNAVSLQFPDESFDAVTSNYVYHNIAGVNKQKLLLETLRVLKKGGVFAIHDIMSPARYGDMEVFAEMLRGMGYARVTLIPTDTGKFMSRAEAAAMMLRGSCLLVGVK